LQNCSQARFSETQLHPLTTSELVEMRVRLRTETVGVRRRKNKIIKTWTMPKTASVRRQHYKLSTAQHELANKIRKLGRTSYYIFRIFDFGSFK
ncbi:MAG: hypothetical protein ACE1ZM_04960, partial [Gammaproteobacteria bacterium]